MLQILRSRAPSVEKLLKTAFLLALIGRFLLPFFFNPLDHIFADAGRHWHNGIYLFHPNFEGGSDPKFYQLFIFILYNLFGTNPYFIAFVIGLLSASMPWFWYKALREIWQPRIAFILSIIIAIHPSLTIIYGYFLTETVTLNMTALSVWMCLRAIRKRTLASYNISILCWILTAMTRLTVAPIALLGILYLLLSKKDKGKRVIYLIMIFLALAIPASIHSYVGIGSLSPFNYTGSSKIYRFSGTDQYEFHIREMSGLHWMSPSYICNPLSPIANYTTYRIKGTYVSELDPTKGNQDWEMEVAKLKKNYTWRAFFLDLEENFIYLFFGPSWPEAWEHSDNFWFRLNFHLRWIWPPLMVLILFAAPLARISGHRAFLVTAVWLTEVLLILQQSGVMEGRYRKPIEPLIIISAYILIESLVKAAAREKPIFIQISLRFKEVMAKTRLWKPS